MSKGLFLTPGDRNAPTIMRALISEDSHGWRLREVPAPRPGPGQLLVRVHAAGLNRADLLVLEGRYPATGPVAGMELAGEVVADAGTGWAPGERVMASAAGAFAELAVVDAAQAMHVPESLGWVEAAALPAGLTTAHDALVTQGGFTAGDTVLVLGGTSAVGLIAVSLARALGAATVVATTTTAARRHILLAAGADDVVDTTATRLPEGLDADVVLDHVGGTTLAGALVATRVGGTIVSVGRLSGPEATLDLDVLAYRRLRLVGTTFTVRSDEERARVVAALAPEVLPAVAAGRIRPVVDRVVPFDAANEALEHMRTGRAAGKIVLECSPS